MSQRFSANDEPPLVTGVAGEVILVGEGVSVAYTPAATSRLISQLVEALGHAQATATAPSESVATPEPVAEAPRRKLFNFSR